MRQGYVTIPAAPCKPMRSKEPGAFTRPLPRTRPHRSTGRQAQTLQTCRPRDRPTGGAAFPILKSRRELVRVRKCGSVDPASIPAHGASNFFGWPFVYSHRPPHLRACLLVRLLRTRLPAKDAATTPFGGPAELPGDNFLQIRACNVFLQLPRLVVQASQRL